VEVATRWQKSRAQGDIGTKTAEEHLGYAIGQTQHDWPGSKPLMTLSSFRTKKFLAWSTPYVLAWS
jgi:hypothetical protein